MGFTLLELLLAMVLLSIVMALLYGSLAQISEGTASLNADLERQQETRLLLRMITDDLQAVNYFDGLVKKDGAKSGLVVSRDNIGAEIFSSAQFHANVPVRFHRRVDRESDPRVHELAYWVEASEDDRNLLVLKRREDFYLDDDMDEGGISATLAERIEVFRIEMLAEPEPSASVDGSWLEEWDSNENAKNRLPVTIRVTLAIADDTEGEPKEEALEFNIESSLGAKP